MRHSILFYFASITLASLPTSLHAKEQVSDYRFNKAEVIRVAEPLYPNHEFGRKIEGWAMFSFVVDDKGNVKSPILIDSSGRRNFELSAMKAVRKMRYKPATLNGRPVESSNNQFKVNFSHPNLSDNGAHWGFLKRYRRIRDEIMDGKLEGSLQSIQNLGENHTRNRYETAWLHILKSIYYHQSGNTKKYIEALKRAIWYQGKDLPKDVLANGLINLYHIQADTHLIADAMKSAEYAEEFVDQLPQLSKILKHKEQLEKALNKHPILSTKGFIIENGEPWRHTLYRKTIGIEALKGKLDRIEFRCSNKTRSFVLGENSSSFNIPKNWKNCTAFIYGDRASQLVLFEQI